MSLEERLLVYASLGVAGVFIFSMLSLGRVFGARGEETVYSFKYKGEPAKLIREDIRWGPDNYFVLIGDKDKVAGELTTDDGKRISIKPRYNSAPNGRYEIRDE